MADCNEKWHGEDKAPREPTPLHWELLFDEDEIFYDAKDSWHEEPKTDKDINIAPFERKADLKPYNATTTGAENQIISELLDLIECIICLDNPRQPSHIYQCQNGHLFCEECLEKVKTCSVCQEPLNKDSRNLMVEKILSILKTYNTSSSTINTKNPPKVNGINKKKIIEPKNLITKKNEPEIEDQEWCTVVRKKKKPVKDNHQEPVLGSDEVG